MGCTDQEISELFESRYPMLCRAVARILGGDHALSEQLVSDSFEALWRNRSRVRPETASSYLWQIALNKTRSAAKRAAKERDLHDKATRDGYFPHEYAQTHAGCPEETVVLRHVRKLVMALPVDQRIVIVLHYYCDWPDAAIAQAVGCPAVTVRSRLRRARKSLEESLTRTGELT